MSDPLFLLYLATVWEDPAYYQMLQRLFPSLTTYSHIPLDEFGPIIFQQRGSRDLFLQVEEGKMGWHLLLSNGWITSHRKPSLPEWRQLTNLRRIARNELFTSIHNLTRI